jgi:hypothetical protein
MVLFGRVTPDFWAELRRLICPNGANRVQITFEAIAWSKPEQDYIDRFGHGPSPETCKFRSDAEISAMAEKALTANMPIEAWKARPSVKLGTVLDDLYD